MTVKNVYYTFEEVIKAIDPLQPGDLMGWMQVITKFYLNERDMVVLEALRAKHEGKHKQRELSVLFCIAQPHLSDYFKRIRAKILNLYNFLQCDTLIAEYLMCHTDLTDRQFTLLQLVMGGNSFYDIARAEQVSKPDVSITFRRVVKRLEKAGRYPYLTKFLHQYKGQFVKN